ncbi:SUPPRESSOR OF ABI3-5 isoform X3 [Physcomitrium patens]|uniref:SUPPRESSOR OF ABI3-5 isoform X3 n=1 Tax=Physcomitrium patens TaxID=3218 RepID=UPI000D154B28|nr:SUPPRESSOR OF ABI3-5-like isoform X3 [Physcomitrium patens]|eukprot:XP_024386380.1 SUPPRESSOR OF ABI3-5-like isoform X3 [Physcomitrella patens]
MDGVRYGLQQASWENSSALESYDPNLGPDLRGGGAYGDRGYIEDSYPPREAGPPYSRGAYPGEAGLDADSYLQHGWPPSRRRPLEGEITQQRGSHRLEKFNQGREIYQRSRRDYSLERGGRDATLERETGRDVVLERLPSRTGSRDRENADGDFDWEYRRDRHFYQDGRDGNRDVDMADLSRPRSGSPSKFRRDDVSGFRGEDISPRERSGRRSRGEDRGRDTSRRRRDRDYDRSRSRSRERERWNWSPDRVRGHERGRSYGHDDRDFSRRFSRSPRSRSRGAGGRESSYDDLRNERRRDRDNSRYHSASAMPPSATLVVKGLSQKISEDDLYQALADWGPLRHVRVIKERSTGVSRGFAFVDFPDVEAAQKMMDGIGYEGIIIDGRRILFEYSSSKPTGGPGILPGPGRGALVKSGLAAADWMCTVCGCNNFARRVVCFQCNEARTDESPAADITAASGAGARRTSEAGPTHVLVVRGLDETVDEESLHCEFSKYAPIKDLRLVRDKFTSVSRGFAFIHFHSVEDAAKALESTNGIALDKNGQLLRVAFAKSIGPASGANSQGSAAAAAAIEAATFAQQYDMIGWAPKEYNPGENAETGLQKIAETDAGSSGEGDGGAPQSGFVWDEASGYYYDSSSGFYYDGNQGLYYDGNSGVWYTYDQDTQQYTPYVPPENTATAGESAEAPVSATTAPTTTTSISKAVIISAPAIVTLDSQAEPKKPTLAEAVAAAAEAAKLTAKKEKEKMKEKERELRKGVMLGAGKKKMNNVMSVWKQRQYEGLTPATLAEETLPSSSDITMDGSVNNSVGRGSSLQASARPSQTGSVGRGMSTLGRGGGNPFSGNYHPSEGAGRARPLTQSSGRGVSVFGVSSSVQSGGSAGRGAGRGRGVETGGPSLGGGASESPVVITPFKTDASALGAFPNVPTTTTTRRRFTETPQNGYRDRAAERRSLYASTLPGDVSEGDGKGKDMPFPPGVGARGVGRGSDMPFPPGVGGGGSKQGVVTDHSGAVMGGAETESFEVITAERALDASNVGNRMLRNMGWQEGSGLGKEGTGIVEPVLAQGAGERAGLGSHSQQKKTDSRFETLPGDSYRIVIQKKALARFHEMI